MPREILFRGFHEDIMGSKTIYLEDRAVKGKWVEGGYAEIAPPPVCFSNDTKEPTTICIVIEEGFADWGMPRRYGLCGVIPSTVGQYTGLNDKNGKKIFEGDKCIVTVFDYEGLDRQYSCKVEYDEGCFLLENNADCHMTLQEIDDTQLDVTIIGTIFDME